MTINDWDKCIRSKLVVGIRYKRQWWEITQQRINKWEKPTNHLIKMPQTAQTWHHAIAQRNLFLIIIVVLVVGRV